MSFLVYGMRHLLCTRTTTNRRNSVVLKYFNNFKKLVYEISKALVGYFLFTGLFTGVDKQKTSSET